MRDRIKIKRPFGRPIEQEKEEAEKTRREAERAREEAHKSKQEQINRGAKAVFAEYEKEVGEVQAAAAGRLTKQQDAILKAHTYEQCNDAVELVNEEIETLNTKMFASMQNLVKNEATYWYKARIDLLKEKYDVPQPVLEASETRLARLIESIDSSTTKQQLDPLRGGYKQIIEEIEKRQTEAGSYTIELGGAWTIDIPKWNWARYLDQQMKENLPEGVEPPAFIEEEGEFAFIEDASRATWTRFAKADAEARLDKAGIKATLIETPTSLIYTTWPESEHRLLRRSMLELDRLLGRTFRRPSGRGVFLGKLPVFCLNSREQYLHFSKQAMGMQPWDLVGVQGYASFNPWGVVRMVIYRRESERIHPTDRTEIPTIVDWATVTAHEMTHAWMARIRSNHRVPIWLEEGLAEFIAYRMTSRLGNKYGANKWELDSVFAKKRYLNELADKPDPLKHLFESTDGIEAEDYPIAMTLVGVLYDRDDRRLIKFIEACKSGEAVWDALEEHYRLTKDEFVDLWEAKIVRVGS